MQLTNQRKHACADRLNGRCIRESVQRHTAANNPRDCAATRESCRGLGNSLASALWRAVGGPRMIIRSTVAAMNRTDHPNTK